MRGNKLKSADVSEIVSRYKNGYAMHYLGWQYDVHVSTIRYWLIKNNVYVKWAIKTIKKPYYLINKPIRKIMPKKKRIYHTSPHRVVLVDGTKTYADYIKDSEMFDSREKKLILRNFERLKDKEMASSFNTLL